MGIWDWLIGPPPPTNNPKDYPYVNVGPRSHSRYFYNTRSSIMGKPQPDPNILAQLLNPGQTAPPQAGPFGKLGGNGT